MKFLENEGVIGLRGAAFPIGGHEIKSSHFNGVQRAIGRLDSEHALARGLLTVWQQGAVT